MLVADSSVQLKLHHRASSHSHPNNRITFTDSNCPTLSGKGVKGGTGPVDPWTRGPGWSHHCGDKMGFGPTLDVKVDSEHFTIDQSCTFRRLLPYLPF